MKKREYINIAGKADGLRSSESEDTSPTAHAAPSRFACLYEGDGRLCLFETHDGHLVAVDASRLV